MDVAVTIALMCLEYRCDVCYDDCYDASGMPVALLPCLPCRLNDVAGCLGDVLSMTVTL